jgi:3-hydroxyacyl-CoA dehydrogenase/enoyl-CoA hydratase/3-hydroxybutyryl-CoA epimerase
VIESRGGNVEESSGNLYRRVKQKQITKARAQQILEKLHTTSTLNGFGNVDILIEAVVEKMEVKKQLFANLEGQLKDAAIIATNTSSLSVTEMATVLKQPQRLVGMHFFNPVHKMPLVEIIAGKQSDVKSLQSVYALALRLKKFPVIVKDSPGFLVNRLLGFYLNEAMFMLLEGAELESIDAALIDFGMPMGPFRLMDVVGLDIIEKAQSHLTAGLGLTAAGGQPRLPLSPLLQKVRDQNLLGEKNQQGFYLYQDGKPTSVNPLIPPMVNELKRSSQTPADDQLWKRPIFMMINEACRCLQEEIIGNPHHLDLAMVMGTGFPGFRGGLLRYAATLGVDAFHGELDEMSKRYGERFKPEANLKSVLQEIQRTTY